MNPTRALLSLSSFLNGWFRSSFKRYFHPKSQQFKKGIVLTFLKQVNVRLCHRIIESLLFYLLGGSRRSLQTRGCAYYKSDIMKHISQNRAQQFQWFKTTTTEFCIPWVRNDRDTRIQIIGCNLIISILFFFLVGMKMESCLKLSPLETMQIFDCKIHCLHLRKGVLQRYSTYRTQEMYKKNNFVI